MEVAGQRWELGLCRGHELGWKAEGVVCACGREGREPEQGLEKEDERKLAQKSSDCRLTGQSMATWNFWRDIACKTAALS